MFKELLCEIVRICLFSAQNQYARRLTLEQGRWRNNDTTVNIFRILDATMLQSKLQLRTGEIENRKREGNWEDKFKRYHIREGDGNVIKMITGRDEEEMAGVDLHIEMNCHFAVQEESRRLCRLLFDDKAENINAIKMSSNLSVVRSVPGRNFNTTRCRHLDCNETEALGHVLGFCRKTELLRNNRHYKTRTGIADVLKRRGWEDFIEGLSDDSVVDKDYVPDADQSSGEDNFDEINLIATKRRNVTAESSQVSKKIQTDY
ncbi:hypothetical protein ANN_02894 [Periplaneta americana]|uniref:Uncharacterized protein n=1 Tax=Periplaneta americana TaxID=6978 RepID=A0ABQ8TZ73_PERAM|nr:hypothetical protein ANN_02894 [Periplaneta americana]